MSEFDGRAAGRAAGEHIGDVTRKVTAFVNDEPDRLMHLATQTGFITPGDERYTRFLTDQQIDTFNRNMESNADLVRAHAEDYRAQIEGRNAEKGEMEEQRFFQGFGLKPNAQPIEIALAGGPDVFAADQRSRYKNARTAYPSWANSRRRKPEEVQARMQALDQMYGYQGTPVAPGSPAAGPAPSGPAPTIFNPAMPDEEPAGAPAAPPVSTARAMMGAGPSLGAAPAPSTPPMSWANALTPRAARPSGPPAATPPMSWSQAFTSGGGRPQPAGPVVTKQPGQPGAAAPQDRAAWLRMLAGE